MRSYRLRALHPTQADRPPSGPGWLHEIKHDGFRLIARRDGAACGCSRAMAMIGANDIPQARVCAEKLDSNILVVQSTDHGMRHDMADLLDWARNGCIHVQ